MGTFCRSCGHWTQTDSTCTCGTSNPRRGATSLQRRARDGRNRRAWQRISRAVIQRDGHCIDCGSTDDLTADRIGGGYHDGNLDAYQTRCRSCHGRVHATGGVSL